MFCTWFLKTLPTHLPCPSLQVLQVNHPLPYGVLEPRWCNTCQSAVLSRDARYTQGIRFDKWSQRQWWKLNICPCPRWSRNGFVSTTRNLKEFLCAFDTKRVKKITICEKKLHTTIIVRGNIIGVTTSDDPYQLSKEWKLYYNIVRGWTRVVDMVLGVTPSNDPYQSSKELYFNNCERVNSDGGYGTGCCFKWWSIIYTSL